MRGFMASEQSGDPALLPQHLECLLFLGSGGEGDVWVARDPALDRKVVCKRLKHQTAVTDGWRLALAAQARAAALTPTIPQVFGVESDAGVYWLILEYIEGPTLEDLRSHARDSMGDAQLLLVVMDLLHALAALGTAGLVHGDINPANVVIDTVGRARLIDFSCASTVGGHCPGGGVAGFRRVAASGSEAADPRNDAYAVGCLLYWLLGVPLPQWVQDVDGHGLMIRPSRPTTVTGLTALLWDTARHLTPDKAGSNVPVQQHLAVMRRESRLLPSGARDALADYRASIGKTAATPIQADELQTCYPAHSSMSSQARPGHLTTTGRTAALLQSRCSDRASLLLPLCGSFALACFIGWLFWQPPMVKLMTGPAQVAANTPLPPSFSMGWVSRHLQASLTDELADNGMARRALLLTLQCDHQVCTLAAQDPSGPAGDRYERLFLASRDPAVWKEAISDLARAVAAH